MKLPISFPSEAEQLRRQVRAYAGMTPGERLQAVADTLAAVDALSLAGGRYEQAMKYYEECEREGRERMREFIAQHLDAGKKSQPGAPS
jgi:hypothetical protein